MSIVSLTNPKVIEIIQFARLCDEARAVLNSSQIAEIAVSMDLTIVEVEARFRHAQFVFEQAKAAL